MKKYIVDRFEGDYAICEDENNLLINIEHSKLPPETKEGDCLIINKDGDFSIDVIATNDKRQEIRSKLDSLFE
ncbi:MAG: DUF3006 domain-containing protein [Clostridiales bacterium]|jgi:hypothetical protein|nr:DUF3006 domain-containing protein [Bacillota bacterium]NLK03748.1 DUF3006 domain-containing protein [Clostridiales bacterium]